MERAEKEEADINNLERLPEGCISDILSLTTPADVCRSSLVSTLFKSAADSDALWEKFLPADYQEIISRALHPFSSAAVPKKDLYYRLCDEPLLIDDGFKSFQLEKSSGKKCIMIGAKEVDNPSWHWLAHPGSRFPTVVVLQRVSRFEICGKLDARLLSPKTLYAAYLEERHLYLILDGGGGQHFAQERGDGWMEVEMGYFYYEGLEDNEDGQVHMSVLETEGLIARCGLIVQGIEVRPKVDTQILL
ncbi:F-box protein PP2-B10-like [Papaver somniferum]|uniref:F-box protein PP2-B10-like n=1 Tax=Papaver somniferum TaxID=3469 RepID=UPI000E6F99E5|nr:F-box protein PP2-B10-like [Papaver somniferum]